MVALMIVGMTLGVIFVVGYPLMIDAKHALSENDSDDLDQRKLSVYRDIKDLEFDLETGKVSNADYQAMRADYETQAVGVLKALDKVKNGQPEPQNKTGAFHNTSGLSCPVCGHQVMARDRFCGFCGEALTG